MRRMALLTFVLALSPLAVSAPAHAQATRTWVSGVGDDVNPCSRTAPCKTFAGAISKTAAGGEINCLDPAGYGSVTITKAMTIDCETTEGSILAAGTFGVTINAAATDRITLRGIKINGVNQGTSPGTNGVRILSAASVSIEQCVITAMGQQGISDARTAANTKLFVRNSVISNNTGNGIGLAATGGSKTSIEGSSIINNLTGVSATTGNLTMISRSIVAGNTTGLQADAGAATNGDSISISGNTTGVSSNNNIRLSNSDITLNTTGVSGTAIGHGNNRLAGNNTNGSLTAAGAVSNNLGEQ